MKRVGIFGGTFNPVHCGHVKLARWLVDSGKFDEVWLTLSPANPLKNDRPGATDADRLEMLRLALAGEPGLKVCDVEFSMPRPSYTIATLRRLQQEHPDCRFSLIVGADNWEIFDRWREPGAILREFGVTVYPRPGVPAPAREVPGMNYLADAPVYPISSTAVRAGDLADVPQPVRDYIKAHNLYE